MLGLFAVIQVLLSAALIGLVLMHSGRDTGFGDVGFTPASQGGQHIVERNLTRLTVLVALLFAANTVVLFTSSTSAVRRRGLLEPGPDPVPTMVKASVATAGTSVAYG